MVNYLDLFTAIEIEINHACNRRCVYCPNSILSRKNTGEMDPALFGKIISELSEISYSGRVSFHFYNEPLLHSDLEGVVQMTRRNLPLASIEVYSNGTLMTYDKFQALLNSGVDQFIITRHKNEKKYIFQEIYDSLTELEKEKVDFRGFEQIRLTNRGGLIPTLKKTHLIHTPCQIPWLVLVVTLDGNVLPCFEDYEEKLVMGNIRNQKLMDIWRTPRYHSFRNELKVGFRSRYKPCASCDRIEVLPIQKKCTTPNYVSDRRT
ncbi:MAG: SPASM domain-containing protein [Bdellovibrionota bacterium]